MGFFSDQFVPCFLKLLNIIPLLKCHCCSVCIKTLSENCYKCIVVSRLNYCELNLTMNPSDLTACTDPQYGRSTFHTADNEEISVSASALFHTENVSDVPYTAFFFVTTIYMQDHLLKFCALQSLPNIIFLTVLLGFEHLDY